MSVSFDYFEHEADIGIVGMGDTLEEAFVGGALALFSVMVDIEGVESRLRAEVSCAAFNIEELFIEWLNTLLAEADLRDMVFSKFEIDVLVLRSVWWMCDFLLFVERHIFYFSRKV